MSFISVEPQSRGFLEIQSNSLLKKFDIQLEIIADRYLAFFQERRRIEALYIDSLRQLHQKANVVDASFDPRSEPTTTRAAWDEVRDSLERDANTQQAFVDVLDNDVIKPLEVLKEIEDRTRQRVEEDLEDSAVKYADHAENTIMKLQQAYSKKNNPRQYAHSTDGSQRPEDFANRRLSERVSALFRSRQEDLQGQDPAKSGEVSDNECRRAIGLLNTLRSKRVENLKDGYDCLEALVFTPTVKNVLVGYMDGMVSVLLFIREIFSELDTGCSTARTKCNNLAMNARARVEKVFAGTDTSGLRASFGHAFSLSIPPLTLYCNSRPEPYSGLIFGVPLLNPATSQDNVPKVIRMCVEEVEKRGLDTHKIYSVGSIYDQEILLLRRRFESEKSFSFSSADNIYSVAILLKLYLWDLPEPLFMLSLADYRNYSQNRARYTENDCSALRSKIRELHPCHKASLKVILQHLFRVASRSDKNSMTLEALAARFCYTILRGNAVLEGGVHVKKLVMEDLIQNAQVLFDERPVPSSPVHSPHMTETTSTLSFGPFMSAEFSRPQVVGSTTQHRSGPVGGTPTSLTSSLSSFSPSQLESPANVEGRLTSEMVTLLSPLLGLSPSQTLRERLETMTQERVIHDARGTQAVETEDVSVPPTSSVADWLPTSSIADWVLPQPELQQHLGEPMVPQSPAESVRSSSTDFSFCSTSLVSSPRESPPSPTASLQSAFAAFSPSLSERSERF